MLIRLSYQKPAPLVSGNCCFWSFLTKIKQDQALQGYIKSLFFRNIHSYKKKSSNFREKKILLRAHFKKKLPLRAYHKIISFLRLISSLF